LSMWHEEFAHNTRKVKRVLGNSFTHGMIYIFCAVCTAVQILEHELWRMIICFCRQICQRRHCVSDSIPAVKSCKNYVLLKKEICVCVCVCERERARNSLLCMFFTILILLPLWKVLCVI